MHDVRSSHPRSDESGQRSARRREAQGSVAQDGLPRDVPDERDHVRRFERQRKRRLEVDPRSTIPLRTMSNFPRLGFLPASLSLTSNFNFNFKLMKLIWKLSQATFNFSRISSAVNKSGHFNESCSQRNVVPGSEDLSVSLQLNRSL